LKSLRPEPTISYIRFQSGSQEDERTTAPISDGILQAVFQMLLYIWRARSA